MGTVKRESFLKRTSVKKSVKKKRSKPRRGRVISKDYKAFIAGFPCMICLRVGLIQASRTEVAHVGDRGLGQKCSDFETIPLCNAHHTSGAFAIHRAGKWFWEHFGIDKSETIAQYRRIYESHQVAVLH